MEGLNIWRFFGFELQILGFLEGRSGCGVGFDFRGDLSSFEP